MSKRQLFCFTHAGGIKDFFGVIENDLSSIDVVKIEYAGHGERYKEPFYQNFDELADDVFQTVNMKLEGEYALFGYSMGSITLVEVLKRIVDSGLPLPKHVFLAAHEPHVKSGLLGFAEDELDDWVKNRTIKFGAVPEKLIHNRVFWRTYLPVYRADYTIIGKYDFSSLNLKLDIPATIFYSETDTPFIEMKKWEKYLPCEYYSFEGTHFFIQQHHKEMAEIIATRVGGIHDV